MAELGWYDEVRWVRPGEDMGGVWYTIETVDGVPRFVMHEGSPPEGTFLMKLKLPPVRHLFPKCHTMIRDLSDPDLEGE